MPHRLPGVQESKNENKTNFNVYINKGEMYQIQEWVSKHRNIETGGDLFGLWLDDHTAVVQFVLGPGKKCRRTTTSFFQDVEYLQQAGSYLTDKHGLCNIGQWHSHHRLSLSKPSQGDKSTVWGNMPVLGLNRYVVFIANITNKVTVNCFLFHYQGRKRSLTKGQFKYVDGNNPLRLNEMVLQNTFDGLESFIQPSMFEREMKFLRDHDDNIQTSTGEKEQNVEHEKSTSPKTTELKNRNDQSEQPREGATFEREMKSGKLRPGLPGVQKSGNKNETTFNVYINEGEMHQIQEWVSKHQNIETGGDLFGLWLDDHTAVVQFVLGPGKKCRRTTTSFFQDVEYLQQAGSYLTDKHGLCNIGQWHSHHRLNLSKPSDGDENTVWGNMPVLRLNRYIVFIANITNKVTVNCFLFHSQRRKRSLTKGQFKYLYGNSPLRLNEMVLQNTFVGLESFINPAMFEREMKFLRDHDDNIKTSTEDKEQNVEHEKSTSPKTTELKNRNDQSEQPREAAAFERDMKSGKLRPGLPGVQKSGNKNKTTFDVHINEGEMYQIQEWVSKHKNIETGGDLFGLWLDDHTAVVQFVLGPGKKCRRTTTSFFQDVEYLQQAGSYLTDKHGLCNIGQWHSHHRLSLSKPSHGDENTVWGNMPVLGLNRYIVFIANITHNKVTVNCFLFHCQGRKRSLTKGQFKYLHGNSPLRLNEMVLQNTFDGLESFIQPAMFESEMKFLRNKDDNMETSTGDKEQNVKHTKSTSPKTRELKNRNDGSEQPRETATFEREMKFLRSNDDIMETSTGDEQKVEHGKSTTSKTAELKSPQEQCRGTATFERRMTFLRDNDDNETSTGDEEQNVEHEKSTTPKTRELKNRNAESLQEQPRETARFEKDEQNVKHGYNTFFEPEQQNRNSLRGNNDAKDSNNILNDKNAKTYTQNRGKSNTNTSFEAFSVASEQYGKNCFRHDNDKDDVSHENNNTYTRNTEQPDTSVSSHQEKPGRNSLQRHKDRKDKRDISNEENFETYKENGEWYDRSNRIQDGRHNSNSTRGYKPAKANNDILKDDKVKTSIRNTERNSAKNSVENGHDNRNSFRREDEAKHNPDDLNKEYIEKFRGNNAKNSVTAGKDNKNSIRGNNDAKDSNNNLKDKNAKTYTENKKKSNTNTSSEVFSAVGEEHGKNCLRPDNDKNNVSHENNNTYTRNIEQHDTSVSSHQGKPSRNSLQRNKDRKDKRDISNEENFGTCTENGEWYDRSTRFQDSRHSSNSSRGYKPAKTNNNILKDDRVKTSIRNTERYSTKNSVEYGHDNRNSFQRENEAKHSPDDLNKDYNEKFRGNNAKNSVTPGKDNENYLDNGPKKFVAKFGQMPEAQFVQRVTRHGTQSGKSVLQQQPGTPKKEQRASLASKYNSQQTTRQVESKNTYEPNSKKPMRKSTVRSIQVAEKQDSEQSSQHHNQQQSPIPGYVQPDNNKDGNLDVSHKNNNTYTRNTEQHDTSVSSHQRKPGRNSLRRNKNRKDKRDIFNEENFGTCTENGEWYDRSNRIQDGRHSYNNDILKDDKVKTFIRHFSDTMRPAQNLQPTETRISQPTRTSHQLPKSTSVHYLGNKSNTKKGETTDEIGDVTSITTQRTPQKQKINGGDNELVNDPSKKGGSGQHRNIDHNSEYYRSPNPECKKVPQSEHQFKIEETPNTRSGTKRPKESHSEGVKNRKKEDKTKGKKTTGCLTCFGKKSRQVSDTAQTNNYAFYV